MFFYTIQFLAETRPCLSLHFEFSLRVPSRSFKVSLQRIARKFLRFEHPTAKKILWFPELKLKQPALSHKKNFLQAQKEVLASALFLGCTVTLRLSRSSIFQLDGGLGARFEFSRS